MTAPASAAQLHALHARLVNEGATAEAAWLRPRLPPWGGADALVFGRAVAPSLDWPAEPPGREVFAPLPVRIRLDSAGAPVDAVVVARARDNGTAEAIFMSGGLRMGGGYCADPRTAARLLANAAGHYLARWRDPDDLRRRDFMRHRKEAVIALHAATCWALDAPPEGAE